MNRTEIARALDKGQYEQTEAGILLRQSRMLIAGEYRHWVNGKDERVDKNLVTNEGIRHLLDVNFNVKTPVPTAWYLSLYSNPYIPQPSLTAALYPSTAGEIADIGPSPPGYAGTVRPEFVEIAATTTSDASSTTNMASKASFTIVTGSTLLVNGAGLHSVATKGATTGVLMSATKFSAQRTLFNNDVFTLAYTVTLTSA